MINYLFCPQCKTKLIKHENDYYCSYCNLTIYLNSKPAADVFLIKDDKVLLAKRGRDPFKGSWDIIGGFLNQGEHPHEGIKREAKEETNLEIKITDFLGFYVDRYGNNGDYLLIMRFIGEITGGKMKAGDDVASLEWVPINNLPANEGFSNTSEGFEDLQKWYKNKI